MTYSVIFCANIWRGERKKKITPTETAFLLANSFTSTSIVYLFKKGAVVAYGKYQIKELCKNMSNRHLNNFKILKSSLWMFGDN